MSVYLLQRSIHELYTMISDGRELLESLLLLAEDPLLGVAHFVQSQHELLAARVYRIR